jgi:hypothetical protein
MLSRWLKISSLIGIAMLSRPFAEDTDWVSMIPTGKELTDWTPRFFGKAVGVNPDTVFRMSPEGYLWVDMHTPKSNVGRGHLYYTKKKLSYYIVRAEYGFPKDKPESGYEDWTTQNNGIMELCPAPADVNSEFPFSIETQLLGPKNKNEDRIPSATWPVGRTGNFCIAGDAFTVNYKGNNSYTSHCTTVTYPDAWKGTQIPWETQWSEITARVLSDSLIQHTIHGVKVMELGNIRLTKGLTPVKDGYVAIQAEGTETLFKTLKYVELIGCMDKTSPAYRSYFVKDNKAACSVTGVKQGGNSDERLHSRWVGNLLSVEEPGIGSVEILKMDGSSLGRFPKNASGNIQVRMTSPGMYLLRADAGSRHFRQSVILLR